LSSSFFYGGVQTYSMGGNPTALFSSPIERSYNPNRGGEDQDRSTVTVQVFCTTCKNTGHSEAQCPFQSRIMFPPLSINSNSTVDTDILTTSQNMDGSFSASNQALVQKVGGLFSEGFQQVFPGSLMDAAIYQVWFTLVVISYMQKFAGAEYISIISKAYAYVQKQLAARSDPNPNATILQCIDWIRPRISK
jgi:hypothetical protein